MQVLLLIITTFWLLALRPVRAQIFFSPIKMFLYGWLLVEGAYAVHMVEYNTELHYFSVLAVVASKVAFVLGGLFADQSYLRRGKVVSEPLKFDQFDRVVILNIVILTAISAFFVAQSMLDFGATPLDYLRGKTLSDIRTQRWLEFYGGSIVVSPLRALASFSSFVLAVLLPYFFRSKYYFLVVISILSCFVVVMEGFLYAGRFSIAILILMIGIGVVDSYSKYSLMALFNIRVAVIGFVGLMYFLVIFPAQRNPYLSDSVQHYLSWLSDAEISGWVIKVSEISILNWLPVFAYSTSYFSGSLDKLNYFLTSTDLVTWYEGGYYNFLILSQVSTFLSGAEGNRWLEIRNNIALLMESAGLSPNPWATGVRDFVIDFGMIGCVLAFVILGVVFQYLFHKGRRNHSFCWKAIVVKVSAASFIFAFISPFQIRFIANGLLALACIVGIRALLLSVLRLSKSARSSG